MQANEDKIKWYEMRLFEISKENVLLPFSLINAKYISINSLYFYIKWSNKCQTLELCDFENISQDWCNYVINNSM